MTKTRWCDECKHFEYRGCCDEKPVCHKGHKPRFYLPKNFMGDFGWKRKCEDFQNLKGDTT